MMKPFFFILAALVLLNSCSNDTKQLSGVKKGMAKETVLANAGEPTSRNNLEVADLWVYEDADRTVVFREDTVFNVITTANARIDSIEMSLKDAGVNIKHSILNAKDSIDSVATKVKKDVKKKIR